MRSEDETKRRSELARALGALGASKGGKSRMAGLSPKARKQLARKAARARWARPPDPDDEPPAAA